MGVRLAVPGAGGTMPRVMRAIQQNPESQGAGGVSVTLGLAPKKTEQ